MIEMHLKSPIQNKIGAVFIPVRDIEKSRDWYCSLLGISPDSCQIMNGHLCPLPMEGTGLILDTMPSWGGKEPNGPSTYETPAFMFSTNDIHAAYQYMKESGIQLVTEVQDNQWFAFRDPDGNLLMIC